MSLAAATILPQWLVLIPSAFVMLAIAAHVNAVRDSDMPETRKRLRIANGVVMLFVVSMLACAMGVIRPDDQPRLFLIAWMSITLLLVAVVTLACLDVLHSLRIHRQTSRDLNRRFQSLRDHAAKLNQHDDEQPAEDTQPSSPDHNAHGDKE